MPSRKTKKADLSPTESGQAPVPADLGPALTRPWKLLRVSPLNPRTEEGVGLLDDLKATILVHGIVQPLLVRAFAAEPGTFEIGAGGRRFRALSELVAEGKLSPEYPVPVHLVEASDDEFLELALIENLQRRDMDPIDEGASFAQLAVRAKRGDNVTKKLADRLGVTQRYVQIRIALANKLVPEAKQALREKRITIEAARSLAAFSPERQAVFLEELEGVPDEAVPSVIEDLVNELPTTLAIFPLDTYEGELVHPHGDEDVAYFADPETYMRHQEAAIDRLEEELRGRFPWVQVTLEYYDPTHHLASPMFRRAAPGDPEAGAVIHVIPQTLEVTVYENLVAAGNSNGGRLPDDDQREDEKDDPFGPLGPDDDGAEEEDAPGSGPASSPLGPKRIPEAPPPPPEEVMTGDHLALTHKLKSFALHSAIVANPSDGLRLACVAILSPNPVTSLSGFLQIEPNSPLLPVLTRLCATLGVSWKTGRPQCKLTSTNLWAALRRLSDQDILELWAALVAAGTRSSPVPAHQKDPLILAVAADLRVEHASVELTDEYLRGYNRRDGLIAIAILSGAYGPEDLKKLDKMTMGAIRQGILASPDLNPRFVPPDLYFRPHQAILKGFQAPTAPAGKPKGKKAPQKARKTQS